MYNDMTEVYRTDQLIDTLIRYINRLQLRGSRKHITNETNGSKHIHRNATYGLQAGTEHNSISIKTNQL